MEVILYLALVIITYFFMEMLTDKNRKVSIVGTILVCCSAFTVMRNVKVTILCGESIILLFDNIVKNKKVFIKIVLSMILGFAFGFYSKTYYHTHEVNSFSTVLFFTYIALAIWRILKYKKDFKFTKKTCLIAILCVLVAVPFWGKVLCDSSYNTFPSASIERETNGLVHLFSYGYSMFLPFIETGKNVVYTSFLSVFPLSLILAMVYVYKKEKHLDFLIPMIIAIVCESIFCMIKTPIYMYYDCVAGAVGLSCIYLYIYMIANIEENIFKLADSAKIVLALLVLYFIMPRPELFMSKGYMYAISAVITLLYFMFINFADKRYQKVLLVVLVLWSLVSTVPVFFLNVM